MSTFSNILSTGSVLTLCAFTALAVGLTLLFRKRLRLKKQAQETAKRRELETSLQDSRSKGLALLAQKKYSEAQKEFILAADCAEKLGIEREDLRNRHNSLVALSHQNKEGAVAALRSMQHLLVELRWKLPPKDKLIQIAEGNQKRFEKMALSRSAENDFAEAGKHYESGNFDEAGRLYRDAYRSAQHSKNLILCALILNDYSRIFASRNDFVEARKLLLKALAIAKQSCPAGHELPESIEWNIAYFDALAAENQVKEALARVKEVYTARDYAQALELAEEARECAVKVLKVDHWMHADALNHCAAARMALGNNYDARADLQQAQQILLEWPEKAASLSTLVDRNLAKCRENLGF
ncbi:MAG: hypothetical protein K2X27_26055 [Candidatus Obscuribacterales bacterium]|nr:hypothetical protein [Candidatus Obscuribacterales bacterium]